MAFLPPFGMLNPLPTVNHNEFQSWLKEFKTRKKSREIPTLIGYASAGVVKNSIRLFFLTAAGAGFLIELQKLYSRTTGKTLTETDNDYLMYEIMEFLRSQRSKQPKGLGVPIPYRSNDSTKTIPGPKPGERTKVKPTPWPKEYFLEPPDQEKGRKKVMTWFERRWRLSVVKQTPYRRR